MQVERFTSVKSGKRESNTLVTYPEVVNNFEKSLLIHDGQGGPTGISLVKFRRLWRGLCPISLLVR